MKVTDLSILEFIWQENTQFFIPIYQRNFSWSKKNVKKFLEDLCSMLDSENNDYYFFWTIMYNKHKVSVDWLNDYFFCDIIDWQQRLTTVYLLLYALKIIDYWLSLIWTNI